MFDGLINGTDTEPEFCGIDVAERGGNTNVDTFSGSGRENTRDGTSAVLDNTGI